MSDEPPEWRTSSFAVDLTCQNSFKSDLTDSCSAVTRGRHLMRDASEAVRCRHVEKEFSNWLSKAYSGLGQPGLNAHSSQLPDFDE